MTTFDDVDQLLHEMTEAELRVALEIADAVGFDLVNWSDGNWNVALRCCLAARAAVAFASWRTSDALALLSEQGQDPR